MRNQIVGKFGEEKACKHLSSLGYKIVRKNYKVKAGEIDLIAKNDTEILFAEVKMRTSNSFGKALESLPKRRIERLFSASQIFVSENKEYETFDRKYFLVAIDAGELKMIQVDSFDL